MEAEHHSQDRFTKGFFTIQETARYLSVSDKSVRRLISRGFFRPSRVLRKILIPREQLEGFYAQTSLTPYVD